MNLDELLHRDSLTETGVSCVFRGGAGQRLAWQAALEQGLRLLRPHAGKAECVFCPNAEDMPPQYWPARAEGIRLRTVAAAQASDGHAMMAVFAACRHPRIVLLDDRASLESEQFAGLLTALDKADLVVGRRPGRPGWNPLDACLRKWLATPVADPLCPIKAVRKSAVIDLALDSRGPLVDLEWIAKMTFRTHLLDEFALPDFGPAIGLSRACLLAQGDFISLLSRPRFREPTLAKNESTVEKCPAIAKVASMPASLTCRRQQPGFSAAWRATRHFGVGVQDWRFRTKRKAGVS